MAAIKKANPDYIWWVSHPEHTVAVVRAENWEQATLAAAEWWGVPWAKVAALCEARKMERAPRCVCVKCGIVFHGEGLRCARCEAEEKDAELNYQAQNRRYWREMGPRKAMPGPKGKRGQPGVCPNCGKGDLLTWNPDTDVSTCGNCGWSNEEDGGKDHAE